MKVVINACYGSFFLSHKARELYSKLNNLKECLVDEFMLERNDPTLVKVVETLGSEANTPISSLVVIEIPDNVDWEIRSCDGREWIAVISQS